MDNLPDWPGAAAAYSRAYRILSNMAKAGHVTVTYRGRKPVRSEPSEDMREFIDALNRGDEERIKGLNLRHARHD